MYEKKIPFKDFRGNPHNQIVQFQLTEREVFKYLPELQFVFAWRTKINETTDLVDLDTEEVRAYYNAFEEILLNAWGVMSDDALHFRKAGRYDFEESALFNACMVYFVTNTEETGALIEGILPKGMDEIVKKTEENLANMEASGDVSLSAERLEIARLRRELAEREGTTSTTEALPPQS